MNVIPTSLFYMISDKKLRQLLKHKNKTNNLERNHLKSKVQTHNNEANSVAAYNRSLTSTVGTVNTFCGLNVLYLYKAIIL